VTASADREAIRDLTNRYAYYADTFQLDKLEKLWAEDSVFDETNSGMGRHHTRKGIRKFFEELRGLTANMAHFVTNQIIEELNETTARGIVFSYVRGIAKTGVTTDACCYYKDDYVKVGGEWQFKSRVIELLLPMKVEEPVTPAANAASRASAR
jgi:hypothetical protein